MVHGPSVAIGAGITAAVAAIVILATGTGEPPAELVPEEVPVGISTLTDNGSPALGSPDAPLTLVEFGDYQCHFCNAFFHETEHTLVSEYVDTGKVRMIFKDFTIIGPDSISAAHGAHCAAEQGMFWEYHDILYSSWDGENSGWASAENLLVFAGRIGLDTDSWSDCMADGRHQSVITASNGDADALGLGGTPTFFLIAPDDEYREIYGAQPFEVFEEIIEAELARAGI